MTVNDSDFSFNRSTQPLLSHLTAIKEANKMERWKLQNTNNREKFAGVVTVSRGVYFSRIWLHDECLMYRQ